MDRDWIKRRRLFSGEYMSGVSGFMDFVRANLENSETILCPCSDCLNLVCHNVQDVERHLNCRGMCMTYTRWIFHGEAHAVAPSYESIRG